MKPFSLVFDMNGNAMDSKSDYSSRPESMHSDSSSSASSFNRVVLLDWIAGRGIAQDTTYLYVTDAMDNSVKRYEKVRTRESGTVTQLANQRRLAYSPEAIGSISLLRNASLIAVTSGTRTVNIFEHNSQTPLQTIKLDYADAPQLGQISKCSVTTFSSICETSEGAVLVGFCGSHCVSELVSIPNSVQFVVSQEHQLEATLRTFSYSPRFDRLLISTGDNRVVLTDRQMRTVQEMVPPLGYEDWEPWLTMLVDSGACFISDRRGINFIWVHSAADGSCLFKLVGEVVPFCWSFQPVKRRRGSRLLVDASPQFNSELIVYNSQVKSLERFFFYLPTIVYS